MKQEVSPWDWQGAYDAVQPATSSVDEIFAQDALKCISLDLTVVDQDVLGYVQVPNSYGRAQRNLVLCVEPGAGFAEGSQAAMSNFVSTLNLIPCVTAWTPHGTASYYSGRSIGEYKEESRAVSMRHINSKRVCINGHFSVKIPYRSAVVLSEAS